MAPHCVNDDCASALPSVRSCVASFCHHQRQRSDAGIRPVGHLRLVVFSSAYLCQLALAGLKTRTDSRSSRGRSALLTGENDPISSTLTPNCLRRPVPKLLYGPPTPMIALSCSTEMLLQWPRRSVRQRRRGPVLALDWDVNRELLGAVRAIQALVPEGTTEVLLPTNTFPPGLTVRYGAGSRYRGVTTRAGARKNRWACPSTAALRGPDVQEYAGDPGLVGPRSSAARHCSSGAPR